jgi:hypothetical protein
MDLSTTELQVQAMTLVTPELTNNLRANGFVKIENAVSKALVNEALKEINKRLGTTKGGTDQFKAKSFPKDPAITNLFNQSIIPYVLQCLLGGTSRKKYHQGAGQLALRFPGDMTPNASAKASDKVLKNVASHWHIDGCPNDFIPGVTDHYGTVHNFDCLVGVLLSDVNEKLSGELCCFPGSHMELANYFTKGDNLNNVYQFGNQALPTGKKTWKIFKKKPVHCTGKAGDVFLANYMTAHFVAPNTSPHIRYAVYFRVSKHGISRKGADGKHNPASMLAPWCYWNEGLSGNGSGRGGGGRGGGGGGERKVNPVSTDDIPAHLMPSEEEQRELNRLYEQVPNNDHTIPPSLQHNKSFEKMKVPKPPTFFNEGKRSETITEEQQTKAAIVLSMLGEMGISNKTYDDVLASLTSNHWDENEALGSFF